jgi:type I restriction enzyme S subunit
MSNKQQIKFQRLESRDIPPGWNLVKLGDEKIALKLRSGGTPLTSNKKYWENGDIPFVKIEDITNSKKFLYNTKNKITKLGLENSSAWLVPSNSLLLSMYASFGEVIINKISVATNQAILGIIINEKNTNLDYIFYQLKGSKKYWLENIQENTQKNLNAEISKNFPILLPPLKEQQKIASILSNLDELIQKTAQIIEQNQRLKKGLMQRLLTKGIGHTKFKETEIGQIPFDWIISTIGQEFTVGSGGTPSRTNPNYFKGDIPWVKTTELDYNYIFDTEEKITKEALKNSSAKFYPKDTFVIAMVGLEAEKTMGRCAILGIDATVNQACAAMQTHGQITIPFIFYYYQTLKRKILSIMAGTKRMNLNLELVKSIKIPVPSIKEQNKITNILKLMDSYLEKNNFTLLMIKNLKKGLMQQLLTGKIRVKI